MRHGVVIDLDRVGGGNIHYGRGVPRPHISVRLYRSKRPNRSVEVFGRICR